MSDREAAGRLRALVGVTVVVLASWAGVVALAPPASAFPSADVTLDGHGYGHGRGMGQWGAFGYALAGLSWQQIVEHYYSTALPEPTTPQQESLGIRVDLTENDGNDVFVTSASAYSVAGTPVAPGMAVWMHATGGGTWLLSLASGCAGPTWTPFAAGVVTPVATPNQNSNLGDPNASGLAMQLCVPGGNLFVRGSLGATYNSAGAERTVNALPLEDYVAGVVPNESPAYWGTMGPPGPQSQNWGFQELEAQAVAVRSYAMAGIGSYGGYADTCDLSCQTYRGLANENPLTDAATLDTLGTVVESAPGGVASGVPLTTEYSSSTGGYTAPGTFPAVPDDGDAVCPPGVNGACNPNHNWKATIPVSSIDAKWPQLGTLETVSVTARNGFGDWGGRVTSMTLVGSAQTVVLTGDQFAAAFNLMSDWFTLSNSLPSPAVAITAAPDGHGYWLNGKDGSVVGFGDGTYLGSASGLSLAAPVVGMASTPSGQGYWEVAADGGIFSYGDAHFYGSTGAMRLNRPIVGMAVTPGSGGYWLVAADGGIFAFGDATFYGSMGAHPLNRPVVGMAAALNGAGYWLVAADGGIFAFGGATFEGSAGATPLVQPIVGMARAMDGNGYWLAAADGGVFSYGDATFYGSAAG